MTDVASPARCEDIQVDTIDRVMTIRMQRIKTKNALTRAMYLALADALDSAATDPDVRAVLLTGTTEFFTTGNDLQDFMAGSVNEDNPAVFVFMKSLLHCPKPVVTSVCGHAVGIGVTLLQHTDINVVGDNARFMMPFVNLGLCPEYGASVLMPRIVGRARATEWLLLGEPFDARSALEAGLVNRVVPAAQAEPEAMLIARKLAAQPPSALRLAKRLMREPDAEQLTAVIENEARHFAERAQSAEFQEAAQAFMQKRRPDFNRFD
jgi:enoyl-CoA hydratase/carnithine racemase